MQFSMIGQIGTPLYMAPEMFEDEEHFGPAVDVYAFAILAYEIVTGKEPFSENGKQPTFSAIIKNIRNLKRPVFTSSIPDNMKDLIEKCWDQDQEKRPSFSDIFKMLSEDFSYSPESVDDDEVNDFLDMIKSNQKSSEKVTFHEEQYLIRMQNTLIATAIALLFSSQFVRVDGVGTHLVENSIGIARQSANDPRWQRIITAFSHANIRKKIAKKYNIKLHVQGRINDGGAKVDEKSEAEKVSEDLISKPSDWSITRIIELFHAICVPK